MAQCASLPTVGGCVLEGSSAAVQPTAVGMVRGMGAGRRRNEGDAREMGDGSAQPEEWGAQGPRLTRRASLEWACWHLDPALGAGMPCVFDFGNVLVTGNMHDGGSGSGGHRGTMHDYVGWRTLQGRRASASAAPGLDGREEASREEMEATLGVLE